MPRVAVLTSGGDAPGMNAALRAVVKLCAARGVEVQGVEAGYEGLMKGRFRRLVPRDVDAIGHMGGTILGSARSRAFMQPEGRAQAAARLQHAEGELGVLKHRREVRDDAAEQVLEERHVVGLHGPPPRATSRRARAAPGEAGGTAARGPVRVDDGPSPAHGEQGARRRRSTSRSAHRGAGLELALQCDDQGP